MTAHKFAGKVVYPVLAAILLFFLLRPFCMEQGKCDYRLLVLLMGIPFGIGKCWYGLYRDEPIWEGHWDFWYSKF